MTEEPKQEIIEAEPLTMVPDGRLTEETVELARSRVSIMSKLKVVAIGATNEGDWVDQGGKPYLTEAGCQKFAGIYGLSFRDIKIDKEEYTDEIGHVINYHCRLKAHFQEGTGAHRVLECDGSSTTKDPFFNRSGERLPLSEVKIVNVRKKAITNAMGRATKKILGLSFTWDEVNTGLESAGKDAGKVASVSYGKGTKGGTGKKAESKSVAEKRLRLGELLMEMSGGDPDVAADLLEKFTGFEGKDGPVKGKRSLSDLSEKAVPVVLRKVEKEQG